MNGRRSAFAEPLVHQPPEIYQPFRLLMIRGISDAIAFLPETWRKDGGKLAKFSERLELAALRRTDGLAYRVHRARQMGAKVGEGCRLYSLGIASEAELLELGDNVIVSGEVVFITHDGAIHAARERFQNVNGHYGRI